MCSPSTAASPAIAAMHDSPFLPPMAGKKPGFGSSEAEAEAAVDDVKSLFSLASPIAAAAIVLYLRSAVSMVFLGRLGDAELAGGSLAIGFANISGYSVLSGLALGMEPLCAQAFGASRHNHKQLSLTLHRAVVFLLASSVPISLLWLNACSILLFLRQDRGISRIARAYLLSSLPDLATNSFIHPIRIYLRAQRITHPVTIATLAGTLLHPLFNLLLVSRLRLGVAGVAAAAAASNLVVLLSLIAYVWAAGLHQPAPGRECLTGWQPLIRLAAPSCVSVCLEWWWYEIMILLCGLLGDPKPAVAAMGILIQTTSLIYIFPSSLSLAVSTRVGNLLGGDRPDRARVLAAVALVVAAAVGVLAMAFAWGTRDSWGRFFSRDEEIRRLTAAALPILGLCELGNAPQTVACGVIRGTARPGKAANVNLAAFYLVGMPTAVGLGFGIGLGFRGLWLGLLSAQISCAALMVYAVGSTDWGVEAERAKALTSAVECGGDEKQPLLSVVVA